MIDNKKELSTKKETVKDILERYPSARDSDEQLYAIYLKEEGIATDSVWCFFTNFVDYRDVYHISDFQSIARLRRMVQRDNPNLCSSKVIEKMRALKENDYEDFFKEK